MTDAYRRTSVNCTKQVADRLTAFITENSDLELSSSQTITSADMVELVIYGRNMGKTIFNKKLTLLLVRALYRPAPPEFDVKAGLNNSES